MTDADSPQMPMGPVGRLTRDIAASAATLTANEARSLVDAYYAMQGNRIRAHNQVTALSKSGEPHQVLAWFEEQDEALEQQVRRALDKYSAASPLGRWARGVVGIGPVIAAGLLAHIDLEKAPDGGAHLAVRRARPHGHVGQGGEAPVERVAQDPVLEDRRVLRQGLPQRRRRLRQDLPRAEGARAGEQRGREVRRPGRGHPREAAHREGDRRVQGVLGRQTPPGAHPRARQALRRQDVPVALSPAGLRAGARAAGPGALPHPAPRARA
jgi:hypothetical protein